MGGSQPLPWTFDDGGRSDAEGHGGTRDTNDCVTRAIAIATGLPYAQVYADLTEAQRLWCHSSRSRHAKRMAESERWHARHGVAREVYEPYLLSLGWSWVPTMTVGSGTTVHLATGELPDGHIIARVSRHVCAVIDGVLHDTDDCSRDGTRAVYGYFTKMSGNSTPPNTAPAKNERFTIVVSRETFYRQEVEAANEKAIFEGRYTVLSEQHSSTAPDEVCKVEDSK